MMMTINVMVLTYSYKKRVACDIVTRVLTEVTSYGKQAH